MDDSKTGKRASRQLSRYHWYLGLGILLVLSFWAYYYFQIAKQSEVDFSIRNSENITFQIVSLKSSASPNSRGPVLIELAGLELTLEEAKLLQHPKVGGIILNKKNFESKLQAKKLINNIRSLRKNLFVAVDQELSKEAAALGCDLIILKKQSGKDLKELLDHLSLTSNSHEISGAC